MKSALFVDFDNVYTQLRQLLPEAAERFARQPGEWLRWLVDSLALPGDAPDAAARRRLLVRRCYLNPNWYQQYRHAFLRAGFEIVDCPPVTSQGKTSTDIHMVLDIVELLQHEVHYDEFIVFSADADFTPVLRKLRRYDRRTTVLAIGFPSAAYQASADLMIEERAFIEGALGLGGMAAGPVDDGGTAAPGNGGPATAASQTPLSAPAPAATWVAAAAPGWAPGAPSHTAASAAPAGLSDRAGIAQLIQDTVDHAAQPVPAATLALRLRQAFPGLGDGWDGCGSFKALFQSLGLSRLAWANGSGGRVYDPLRHEIVAAAPASETESHWPEEDAELRATWEVVHEVCLLTGAPLLAPADLRQVLDAVADDLSQHPFELGATARRVCEACLEGRQLRVSLRDVLFLLRGMRMNGHAFGTGHDDRATLAERLISQIRFLCEREQRVLDEESSRQIRRWIAGE